VAHTLAGDLRRARQWAESKLRHVHERAEPAVRTLAEHPAAQRLAGFRDATIDTARRIGWRRFLLAFAAFTLVAAVVPAVRWPTLRVVATGLGEVVEPVTPGAGSFEELPTSSRVVDRNGQLVADLHGENRRQWISLADLPDHVRHAVLAAEDRNFYEHPGVDPTAIVRAAMAQARGGEQGGSTITQQLAKLNYTGGEVSLLRKAREVLYAARLEREYSKDELLERYVNQVYFGDGAYGIAQAAKTFFGVEPRELSPAQAATLAGKIRSPDGLDPHEAPDAVVERRNQVLDLMASQGWLSEASTSDAADEPLDVLPPEPPHPAGTLAPWFVDYVKWEARGIEELGSDPASRVHRLLTGGLTVETTLDLQANQAAQVALNEALSDPEDPTGAVVSLVPGDGAIAVMVGGRNYEGQKFNAAAQAERQPGSAFKPFVYLTAIRDGIDPRSRFPGSSMMSFEHDGVRFQTKNYGSRGYGMLDLDSALARSVNTVYMQLGLKVGPEDVVETAQQAGIDRDISPVPAVALGGINPGVTPLEMAAAYATFAAAGEYAEPYAIRRIVDADGGVVYDRTRQADERFPAEQVGVLNKALIGVVDSGTGTGAALDDRTVAGKTGTTSDNRDAWFVGFAPQLSTAVWVGNLDNTPMGYLTGGSVPASVFQRTMAAALSGVPPAEVHTTDAETLDLVLTRPDYRLYTRRTSPPATAPPTTVAPTTPTTLTPAPPTTAPPPPPPSSSTTTTAPPPPEDEQTTETTTG